MNTYDLELLSATETQQIGNVVSFVGEDASGSFGVQAGHTRLMTPLVFGLARFRCQDDDWQYLALPGGMLYFVDNRLRICTRRFLLDRDYQRISTLLQEQLLAEETNLTTLKRGVHRMEQQLMRRLWELGRDTPGLE
ncbi:F0F1 ATP synthase subunit epsilon [Marinobacterium sp. YM272]|uniref:F0F1 ATP synthase subunit epsilon n=1 Tax=Marinobacterium sp. YM272 TaxID=3421654 RepID=UPI003D7FE7CC